MEIITLALGALDTNCYIVHRAQGTLIIDPAAQADLIMQALDQRGWTADAVVLTHGHFDHILATNDLPVEGVHIHLEDAHMLRDARANLSALWSTPFYVDKQAILLQEGDALMGFNVLSTPGHTPGGICLYDAQEGVLFCGDTLFQNGYGRTDFPGGDAQLLAKSIARLLQLPDETRAMPGHGAATTIAAERRGGAIWSI